MASPRGRIGSTVRDKYRVDTFIATGSMANVYAATHRNGGRVALKILHRELASDPQMRERFKREGYFCNAIEHPGIAKAIDDDVTDDDCPYIVMELLEGENLEVRRKRVGGRLPLNEVLTVADGVLDVLAAAHAKGVLHRDLKPENVFLTNANEVKLLDFGVARWNDGKQSSDVTGVGMVLGTPAFMPPEQALGLREEVDARSDIWALGATLFTLLTGESVHTGDNAKAKLVATATKPARKLQEVLPNLPSAVTAVIDRALEYHRQERWDDAKAMREALRWARMSLDPEAEVMTSSSPMVAATPLVDTTRRVRAFTDDEPTVMRKAISDDEVFTSAPPITARSTSTTPRTTIPDDGPLPLSDSGESIAFSLRNDPVFSLRRQPETENEKKSDTDRPPNTQRLADEVTALAPTNELGLPSLEVNPGPPSEDVRMEYTRPYVVPANLRGTLPLPPGQTGSGIVPVPPPPAPSNPQLPQAPAAPMSTPQPISSNRNAAVAPAPASSNTGTKVFLGFILVAMLAGTVVVLWMRKPHVVDPHPAPLPSSIAAAPSAAPSEPASGAPSTEPAPIASEAPSASSEPVASASAMPEPSASVVATPKPKPRPKPQPSASAASTSEDGTPSAPATTTTATTATTSTATQTATAAPVPVPLPVPVPSPTGDPQ